MPEPSTAPLVAMGVDGARAGWAAACLYADATGPGDASVWQTVLRLCRDIGELDNFRTSRGGAPPVAIDTPIGLLDSVDFRPCDVAARDILGKRRNAVFAPPARYMLDAAGDYPRIRKLVEAERERNPKAKGLSAQAAGLTTKVAEVDAFMRADKGREEWLFECHPELSFYALAGAVPGDGKRSAAGLLQRLHLIRDVFPDVEQQIATAPWDGTQVELADVLDAYAALTTAVVCARGDQEELGRGERDSEGLLMRMVL
jgi:predicted RNase H-like nuclease